MYSFVTSSPCLASSVNGALLGSVCAQRVIDELQGLLQADVAFVPAVLDALANMQLDQELQVNAGPGGGLCLGLV